MLEAIPTPQKFLVSPLFRVNHPVWNQNFLQGRPDIATNIEHIPRRVTFPLFEPTYAPANDPALGFRWTSRTSFWRLTTMRLAEGRGVAWIDRDWEVAIVLVRTETRGKRPAKVLDMTRW